MDLHGLTQVNLFSIYLCPIPTPDRRQKHLNYLFNVELPLEKCLKTFICFLIVLNFHEMLFLLSLIYLRFLFKEEEEAQVPSELPRVAKVMKQ